MHVYVCVWPIVFNTLDTSFSDHRWKRNVLAAATATARQANHTSTCTRAGLTHLTIQTLVLSLPTWFSLVDEKCICIVPLLRPIRYTINLALIDRNQTAAAIPYQTYLHFPRLPVISISRREVCMIYVLGNSKKESLPCLPFFFPPVTPHPSSANRLRPVAINV